MPKKGLEPLHLAAQASETCVSTNSTTWATPGTVEHTPARQPTQARISAPPRPSRNPGNRFPATTLVGIARAPRRSEESPSHTSPIRRLPQLARPRVNPLRLAAPGDYLPPADAALVAELMPRTTFHEGGGCFLVKQEGEGPLIRPGDTLTARYRSPARRHDL